MKSFMTGHHSSFFRLFTQTTFLCLLRKQETSFNTFNIFTLKYFVNRIAGPRSKREGCPQREGSRQLRVGGEQHSFIHLSAHLFVPSPTFRYFNYC
jgi:hypothetical protein